MVHLLSRKGGDEARRLPSFCSLARDMVPVLLGLLAFLLYLRTLAPDVFVSDFAEFQYLPAVLGLPHPNGFPLYMLLGWAWSHIPWGNLAWRMNLLSAVGGGMAVALTAYFAQRMSGRVAVGGLAAGLLAVSPTFWGYSLLAERYTLNLGLLVGALLWAWLAAQGERVQRNLVLSALFLGMGLAVHPSDALLLPFWLAYLIWRVPEMRRSWQVWGKMLLAGVLPNLLYLYVPWRWAAFASWPVLAGIGRSAAVYKGLVHVWYEPPLRWDLVWYYITGLGGYATGLLAGGWRQAFVLLKDVWPYWTAEIHPLLFLLSLIGGIRLWRRDRALTGVLAAFVVFLTLMVAYIQQGKNDAYLMPAFWVVFFAAGFALDVPPSLVRLRVRVLADLLLIVYVLVLLFSRYPDRDLSRRVDIRRWWETLLTEPVEQGAGLLGHWSDFTPLWYLQQTEHVRPDLWGLFPPDEDAVIRPWLSTGTPLYLAAPTHGWAPHLDRDYTLVPWGYLVRVVPRDTNVSCMAGREPDLRVGPVAIAILRAPQRLTSDQGAVWHFCWRTERSLPRNTFVVVHLEPQGSGMPLDLSTSLVAPWYPQHDIPAGTEGLSVVPARVPLGTPGGKYKATLSFLQVASGGGTPIAGLPTVPLGEVMVEPTRTFVRHWLPRETVPLIPPRVGPLTLRAWYLSDLPVRPGDPLRLELVWEVRETPTRDLSLAVRFWGHGGRGMLAGPYALVDPARGDQWRPGTFVRTVHDVRAPRGVGDHSYAVEIRVLADGQRLSWFPTFRWWVGRVHVHDRPHQYLKTLPSDVHASEAVWADLVRLRGYRVVPESVSPGEQVTVTLYWQALAEMDLSYKVFVHLVDKEGHLVAQHDGVPVNGTLPTDLWVPGEDIVDEHVISLPADVPPGTYEVRVGLYDPRTGERLPLSAPYSPADRAWVLASVTVK